MSFQLMLPEFDPLFRSIIRDDIIERLQDSTLEDLVAELSNFFLNWQAIEDPILRTAGERFTLLLVEGEQYTYVCNFIRSFHPFYAVDQPETSNKDVVGGIPPLAIAFGIGIATGVLGNLIYDEGRDAIEEYLDKEEWTPDDCVDTVKIEEEGETFCYCVNARGYIDGEPWECDEEESSSDEG